MIWNIFGASAGILGVSVLALGWRWGIVLFLASSLAALLADEIGEAIDMDLMSQGHSLVMVGLALGIVTRYLGGRTSAEQIVRGAFFALAVWRIYVESQPITTLRESWRMIMLRRGFSLGLTVVLLVGFVVSEGVLMIPFTLSVATLVRFTRALDANSFTRRAQGLMVCIVAATMGGILAVMSSRQPVLVAVVGPWLAISAHLFARDTGILVRLARTTVVVAGGSVGPYFPLALAVMEVSPGGTRRFGAHRWFRRLYGGSWHFVKSSTGIVRWIPSHESDGSREVVRVESPR